MVKIPQNPTDSPDGGLGDTIYGTLRKLAAAHLRRERRDHTLAPTALVHEAWMRMEEDAVAQGADKTHFLALASQSMRRILVDHARARGAAKRGGDWKRVTLSAEAAHLGAPLIDILDLNDALTLLSELSERQAKIVELRFFGGLPNAIVADVLKISVPTVVREWRVAQAWLLARLSDSDSVNPGDLS